jgi:hypothetical protein
VLSYQRYLLFQEIGVAARGRRVGRAHRQGDGRKQPQPDQRE